ncbi:unnamed protein product, partial [Meganyctiphanes norvegica]
DYIAMMKSVLIQFLLFSTFLLGLNVAADQDVFSPYQMGPYNSTFVEIGSLFTLGLDMSLSVWVPLEPGTYPIIYYLDGFDMLIPGMVYNETLEQVASHGFTVVIMWKVSVANPSDKVPEFKDMLAWAEEHLEKKLHREGVPEDVHLDMQTLIGGGHSSGAHGIVSYLQETCGNFKALILQDPVDGADPYGIIHDFAITPGEKLNFALPTYHLSAGLDPTTGAAGTSCAPDWLSNERFWNALSDEAPRWSINATEYGHGDFLNLEAALILVETRLCGDSYQGDDFAEGVARYRAFVAGQMVAFCKAVLEEDCSSYLPEIEDASRMSVAATVRIHNPNNECPKPSCTWKPMPSTTIMPTEIRIP